MEPELSELQLVRRPEMTYHALINIEKETRTVLGRHLVWFPIFRTLFLLIIIIKKSAKQMIFKWNSNHSGTKTWKPTPDTGNVSGNVNRIQMSNFNFNSKNALKINNTNLSTQM